MRPKTKWNFLGYYQMLSYEMINYIIWKESRLNCSPAFILRLFYHHGFLQMDISATFDKSFCAVKISLSGQQCVHLSIERCLGKIDDDWRVTLALRITCANKEKKFGSKDRHALTNLKIELGMVFLLDILRTIILKVTKRWFRAWSTYFIFGPHQSSPFSR